jgi:hypothetical protein
MLKDLLDCLSGAAAFGGNIGVGLFSAILIGGNLLKDLLLKFTYTFGFFARMRSVNNVAVNYKGICSRIPAAIKGLFDQILKASMFNFGNIFNLIQGGSHSLYSQGLGPGRNLIEDYS